MSDAQPIEKGDRFVTRDSRDEGRVVEVIEVEGLSARFQRIKDVAARHGHTVANEDELREKETYVKVEVVAHPRLPFAVGHVSRVSAFGLRRRYRRVSR